MTYALLCYKKTVEFRGKYRKLIIQNVNNTTHYDLLPIVLQKNSSFIVGIIGWKME